MDNRILEITDIHFSYHEKSVLKGVGLQLRKGEILCLLGPNGCGKTTLLDCILGLLHAESGSIRLENRDTRQMGKKETARHMAYVPQSHDSSFPYSVAEFVLMGRTPHLGLMGTPGKSDRRKVKETLKDLNLQHLAGKDYSLLSGGESRMVMIARALVQEASVLIMDEPGSHLDFSNEILMLETILSLVKEQSRSVLMSTHSPNQVFFLESCGVPVRAAVMNEGRIITAGKPAEVLKPELLKEIYGVNTALVSHNQAESILNNIIPLPSHLEVSHDEF